MTWTDRNDYDESRAEHEALRATRHDPIDPYYPHPTQETTTMSNHEAFLAQVNDALGHEPLVEPEAICTHCDRRIVNHRGIWIDPEADGDDVIWRETCDRHDTFTAEHEPAEDTDPTPPHGTERPMTFTSQVHVLGPQITQHRHSGSTHFITFEDEAQNHRVTLSLKDHELPELIRRLQMCQITKDDES